MISKIFHNWITAIDKHKKRIVFSLLFAIAAFAIYWISGDYVSEQNWSSVPDMILNNFGPYDLSFIFIWLYVAVFVIFITYPLIKNPHEWPYSLNMLGLFIIIRSAFMLFTHIGVPSDAIKFNYTGLFSFFDFTNDLFFSGHTGLPFLGFLVYRKNRLVSYFMLTSSIILGITVLLMHIHYTIDVFSAFFITYGIYKMGSYWFKR